MDFAASVFRLRNRRGYAVPAFNFAYREKDSEIEWRCTCGGTRAYMVRFATPLVRDLDEQAADSHFMMRRISSALLLSGFGLFEPQAEGRLLFTDVWGETVNFMAHLDQPEPELGAMKPEQSEALFGWIRALSGHTCLRRAAEDAHTALLHPHEALIYVYRGLEWLVVGMNQTWENLAKSFGATVNEIRDSIQLWNMGVRITRGAERGERNAGARFRANDRGRSRQRRGTARRRMFPSNNTSGPELSM